MRSAALFMILTAMAGCGSSGPTLVDVQGLVTLDGEPLPNATVIFNPDFPGGSNSLGKTDSAGKYRLEYSQEMRGALVGKHNVQITTKKTPVSELPDDGSVVPTKFVPIPPKYRKPGSLFAEVKNHSNEINFALDSK